MAFASQRRGNPMFVSVSLLKIIARERLPMRNREEERTFAVKGGEQSG